MSRPCGPRPNKFNKAYTKDELVDEVVKLNLYSKRDAERLSMKGLCDSLKYDYEEPEPLPLTKYGDCIKYQKKKDLIEIYADLLSEKGFTPDKAKVLKKDKICDIIYGQDTEFVVPEDFTEDKCDLYDMPTLTRIAVRKNIDTTRYTTQPELCRAIHTFYLREKMDFNINRNPSWNESYECLIPPTKHKELKEHQIRVVKHILTHRSLLVVHATGTGKTLTAVSSIHCMMSKYPNIKIIIITPLSLVDNMSREIRKYGMDLIDDPSIYSRIEIYSYDEYVNLQRRKRDIDCQNTFLIIDEAHNLRTDVNIKESELTKGSRTHTIMRCASQCFKVLLLTATPIVNNPFDLRNLVMMLDGKNPDDKEDVKEYSDNIISSLGNLVNCKVSYYDPPLDENYPKRIDNTVDLYMEPEYYSKYKELEDKYFTPIVSGKTIKYKNTDFFYHNLRIAINSLDAEMSPKVNWIIDFILKEAREGRKSIVYSNWKKAGMNLLRKRLDSLDEQGLYIYISGDITKEVRKLVRKKFNKDQTKILLITRAGGEGLDLKGVENVILMESNWNASSDAQIIGRGVRYKSHTRLPEERRKVNVYRLLLHKPLSHSDNFESVDDLLYDKAYNKKLPVVKEYLQILKDNSIESQTCSCSISKDSNSIGCQSISTVLPFVSNAGVKQIKQDMYEAPSGLTSIAITIDEVNKRLFKKIAGFNVKKKPVIIEEEEEEEDISMGEELGDELRDEYNDELQNKFDSISEDHPINIENVNIDREEAVPEVEGLDEEENEEEFEVEFIED
jgi:superfamily II DNA or RNA helicase